MVVRGWPWPRRVCGKEIRRAIRAHRRAGRVRGTGCSASRLQHVCEFRCAVGGGAEDFTAYAIARLHPYTLEARFRPSGGRGLFFLSLLYHGTCPVGTLGEGGDGWGWGGYAGWGGMGYYTLTPLQADFGLLAAEDFSFFLLSMADP